MTGEEYRSFWEKLLGRYPEFNPTKQQTEDWHRELNHKDAGLLESTVATIITKFTSNVPKLPWLINTYNNISNERSRDKSIGLPRDDREYTYDMLLQERAEHIRQLQETDIEKLRQATRTVIKRYKPIVKMPKDGDIENWSPWLRAAIWCNLYG